MRVLIYGGRDWTDWEKTVKFLDEIDDQFILPGEATIVVGRARGADSLGEQWAKQQTLHVEAFPADWKTHGKAAGHIRNQQMLDSGIDLAVQFPGGRGTADMRRRLDAAGVKVVEYEDEG